MNWIAISGLTLDLVGVALLGFDLLRVQYRLKASSTSKLQRLEFITSEYGGIDGWLKHIKSQAEWRDGDVSEGRFWPLNGSFDAHAAMNSFKEAVDATDALAKQTSLIAEEIAAEAADSNKLSQQSLWFTYIGLILIITGFVLQIAAYLI